MRSSRCRSGEPGGALYDMVALLVTALMRTTGSGSAESALRAAHRCVAASSCAPRRAPRSAIAVVDLPRPPLGVALARSVSGDPDRLTTPPVTVCARRTTLTQLVAVDDQRRASDRGG